ILLVFSVLLILFVLLVFFVLLIFLILLLLALLLLFFDQRNHGLTGFLFQLGLIRDFRHLDRFRKLVVRLGKVFHLGMSEALVVEGFCGGFVISLRKGFFRRLLKVEDRFLVPFVFGHRRSFIEEKSGVFGIFRARGFITARRIFIFLFLVQPGPFLGVPI